MIVSGSTMVCRLVHCLKAADGNDDINVDNTTCCACWQQLLISSHTYGSLNDDDDGDNDPNDDTNNTNCIVTIKNIDNITI